MFNLIIILLFLLINVLALVTVDHVIKVLKENKLHGAIKDRHFLRIMDKIFNVFFEWNRWKKILPISFLVIIIAAGLCFY